MVYVITVQTISPAFNAGAFFIDTLIYSAYYSRMTQFILDSGDPDEYRHIATLLKTHGQELFGGTTNPTLIAKKLAGRKVTPQEAFNLQKDIVLELTEICPGAISAEVYADSETQAQEMIDQAKEIASWHNRVVVKLPTNSEGMKARISLRRSGIPINNTLVFSQQQIFAINLQEQLLQKEGEVVNNWPPFISPFVGRLDDLGQDGMDLVDNAMTQKNTYAFTPLILVASIRRIEHFKRSLDYKADLITAPAKIYQEWFAMDEAAQNAIDTESYAKELESIDYWNPQEFLTIQSVEELQNAMETGHLDITHELTDKGIARFTEDWKAILA